MLEHKHYIHKTHQHILTYILTHHSILWQVTQPAHAVGGVVLTLTVGSTIWATPLEGASAG